MTNPSAQLGKAQNEIFALTLAKETNSDDFVSLIVDSKNIGVSFNDPLHEWNFGFSLLRKKMFNEFKKKID